MADNLYYSDVEHQIEKLRKQKLLIPDTDYDAVANILNRHGYSNIIKCYRAPYIINTAEGIEYREGVSFRQIYSLYMFDKNLRNAVMATMLDLEEYLKEAAANVLSRSFGVNPENYLKFSNFQNRRKRKTRFSLKSILDDINTAMESDKEPIAHYRRKYGSVPPWILFKGIYFSTIINFIDQFKQSETQALTDMLYSKESPVPDVFLRRFMMDSLFICLEYRNTAAHGGMIYNMRPQKQLIGYGDVSFPFSGFSILLFVLGQLKYDTPYTLIANALNSEIDRHCSVYPADVTYLGQILNVNITPVDSQPKGE